MDARLNFCALELSNRQHRAMNPQHIYLQYVSIAPESVLGAFIKEQLYDKEAR